MTGAGRREGGPGGSAAVGLEKKKCRRLDTSLLNAAKRRGKREMSGRVLGGKDYK